MPALQAHRGPDYVQAVDVFRRSEPLRTLRLQPTRFLALLYYDGRSLAEMFCKLKRIPVRETNAGSRR